MTNSMILGWSFNHLKHGEFARNIRAFCDGDNEVFKAEDNTNIIPVQVGKLGFAI